TTRGCVRSVDRSPLSADRWPLVRWFDSSGVRGFEDTTWADRMKRVAAGGGLFGILAVGLASAIELGVGTRDIEEALKLARGAELERGRFHAAYQVPVSGSSSLTGAGAPPPAPSTSRVTESRLSNGLANTIESLDVITEYRRMVLLAEERAVM